MNGWIGMIRNKAPSISPKGGRNGEDNSEDQLNKHKKSRIKRHPNRVPSPLERGWGEAMQELIDRLTQNAGISAEQAAKALETIKDYVKEKFPMLGGAVDNMFASTARSDDDAI